MIHELKIDSESMDKLFSGNGDIELRSSMETVEVGDWVIMKEDIPESEKSKPREACRRVKGKACGEYYTGNDSRWIYKLAKM